MQARVRRALWLTGAALLAGLCLYVNATVPPELARLQRILAVLQVDPALLWRQRSLLDVAFEGTRVVTDAGGFRLVPEPASHRLPGARRVVAMGASPTFGYGVEAADAWPAVTGRALAGRIPGLEIINAGQIGYSSWQGLRLWGEVVRDRKPELAVVSYVVNDIERIRFFFPNGSDDAHTPLPGRSFARVRNALESFGPTALFIRQLVRTAAVVLPRPSHALQQWTHVRTTPHDYEANLLKFVALSRARGIRLVFLVLPFRLPAPIPPRPAQADVLLAAAEVAFTAGDCDLATRLVDQCLALDTWGGQAHDLRGRLLEREGHPVQAKAAYATAARHVIYDCARDARTYNTIMTRVARDTDTPLVDPTPALGNTAANMELFVAHDYIHPNAAGHRIIADCVAPVLQRVLAGERGGIVQVCK